MEQKSLQLALFSYVLDRMSILRAYTAKTCDRKYCSVGIWSRGVWGEAGSGATARSNGAVFSFREFPGPIGPWELTNRKYCEVDVK